MMETNVLRCLLLLTASVLVTSKITYDNYKLLSVRPTASSQLQMLAELEGAEDATGSGEVEFWDFPRQLGRTVTLAVSPSAHARVTALLEGADLTVTVVNDNLQSAIDEEQSQNSVGSRAVFKRSTAGESFDFDIYHRHSEINEYLEGVARKCDRCEVFSLGQSGEGRDMNYIKISPRNLDPNETRPAFWIDAGIHAREWIAPATALNMINRLVHLETEDDETQSVMRRFDWYIMPSMNPDGYEFSHERDRLWRKTRSSNGIFARGTCRGTDPNRNWDYHWNDDGGASIFICDQDYRGPDPFSELETRHVARFLEDNGALFRVYLSFHSFGQYVLLPWGYTNEQPHDYQALQEAANAFAAAIREHSGRNYSVGPTMDLLYKATGISQDWAKGVAGIPYAYTVELPETMDSQPFHHFALPPRFIRPVGEEIWLGLTAMARTVLQQTSEG